jgi:(1->4)-alpha-D-glucan 1-alpha-D-glucosylmutase
VLARGQQSPFARYFDVDWRPPKPELRNKVLLPVLGDQYGKVLESGDLHIADDQGALFVHYGDRRFPLSPTSAAALRARSGELETINGCKGQPHSFDRLEELLAAQAYRLSFWRVAGEQINYRRFFDINDLAAIRMEDPAVMDAVHGKIFDLVDRGWITGLRVDHVDGLRDPRGYLDRLAERCRGIYVVVEKIIAADERMPLAWAAEGATGYKFLNQLNGLWIARTGERPLRALFDELRATRDSFADVVYESKRLILQSSMAGELSVLARRLDRISEQHRWSRDFTLGALQQALTETIACFPVYRTYIAAGDTEVPPQAVQHVRAALAAARRRNPALEGSVFTFLGEVLLMRDPDGLSEEQRTERRDFVARFQQLTGPVMAKGLEDTAFYRYFPLLSLNEVGGGPDRFGMSVDEFHRAMEERTRERPGGMSATSTHDTKRGEDARVRLDVLSEIPAEWAAAVGEWRRVAARRKSRGGGEAAPDAEDEYYIFQTLVGALPFADAGTAPDGDLITRVQQAVEKAMREAKRNSSWIDPNAPYEQATREFIARLLDPTGPFLPCVTAFLESIRRPSQLAALAQLVVKATAPGIPDFYQGTELWDLSMVDPDNRRPVDFAVRRRALAELSRDDGAASGRAARAAELLASADDGRIKLWLTATLLRSRRRERDLFAHGSYIPLAVEGPRRDNVVAFARRWQGRVVIVIASRFFTQLPADGMGEAWQDTAIAVPPEVPIHAFIDELTGTPGRVASDETSADAGAAVRIPLGPLLGTLPFAVLFADVDRPNGAGTASA